MVGLKFYIKECLEKQDGWTAGGVIEDDIGSFTKYKGGTIGRALRDMAEKGQIEKDYKKFAGSPRFVVYKK